MTIGILELDKVSHLPFETFLPTAWAPIDVFGRERGFPLGKCVRPADIKANVIKHRLRSRTRGQAVLIAIDPYVRHGSVRRVGGRKTKHVVGKMRECFAIRHADTNLHNLFYRCHEFLSRQITAAEISPHERGRGGAHEAVRARPLGRLAPCGWSSREIRGRRPAGSRASAQTAAWPGSGLSPASGSATADRTTACRPPRGASARPRNLHPRCRTRRQARLRHRPALARRSVGRGQSCWSAR